jgi:hypothetical protein
MRAFVVAHAGPLIGPSPFAACAFIEIEKPGHGEPPLRSQTIISSRDEINISAVTQILKLLTYFGFDILVTRVKVAEMPFKGVDLVQREVSFAERLDAFHDIEQPAARLGRFIPEEKCPLPFREH